MKAQAGFKFLLKKGTASSCTTVAGLRATTMTLNNELIDITHKDSEGARTLLEEAGMQSLTLSASGVFLNTKSEEDVRECAFKRAINVYSLFFGNGDTLEGNFYITNYERAGDHNGEETYNLTLESSGPLKFLKPNE
jgi:TP901-1 family phage major tail protein